MRLRGVLKRKRRYLIYYVTSLLGGQILPPSKIILFLGVGISLDVATAGLHAAASIAVEVSILSSGVFMGADCDCEHKYVCLDCFWIELLGWNCVAFS